MLGPCAFLASPQNFPARAGNSSGHAVWPAVRSGEITSARGKSLRYFNPLECPITASLISSPERPAKSALRDCRILFNKYERNSYVNVALSSLVNCRHKTRIESHRRRARRSHNIPSFAPPRILGCQAQNYRPFASRSLFPTLAASSHPFFVQFRIPCSRSRTRLAPHIPS